MLAAATAFTFAPVANLGVSAYAVENANVDATLRLPTAAYSSTPDTSNDLTPASRPGDMGYTSAKRDSGITAIDISELKVMTKSKQGVFRLSGDLPAGLYSSIKKGALGKGYSGSAEVDVPSADVTPTNKKWTKSTAALESTAWNKWDGVALAGDTYAENHAYIKAGTDGILNMGDFYITNPGTYKFTLVEVDTSSLENINVTIVVPDQQYQKAPTYKINNATTTGSGATTKLEIGSELTKQGNTYELQLNKNNPGYAIQYTGTPTYTDWTGESRTITKIKLNAKNRSIQWLKADYPTSGDLTMSDKVNGLVSGPTWYFIPDAEKDITTANQWTAVFKTTAAITLTSDSIDTEYISAVGSSKGNVTFSTDRSDNAIDDVYDNGTAIAKNADGTFNLPNKDRLVNNKGKITVRTESPTVYYRAVDPSIIKIDETTGEYTILKKGDTQIYVFTAQTLNNNAKATIINVHVDAYAHDKITFSDTEDALYTTTTENDTLDLDVPTQTAKQAIKSTKITAKSAADLPVTWQSDKPGVVTVDKDGNVTAVSAGTAKLTATTKDDNTKEVWGTQASINVTVWTLPASVFTISDVTVEVNKEESLIAHTAVSEPADYSIKYDYNDEAKDSQIYSLTNKLVQSNNTQTTSKVKGVKLGTGTVQATVLGQTNKYRPTTHKAKVYVTDKSQIPTITLDDNSKALALKVGDTAQLAGTASNKNTVKFSTNDTSVVTVTTGGAVVAVAEGKATITASADGVADSVSIPVVVTAQEKTVAPAKVTGVKVSNKKGAYVSVKWASQGKNINYRVWKKVGNGKWVGKNVAGNKTTLSVKKGAKVQVKVKAYVKDSTGKTTWGPTATKAKTFKTDKK